MSKIKEDVAVNSSGAGNIAGMGSGKQGEPGVPKMFAGNRVFKIPTHKYLTLRNGKKKYARYEHYVGDDEIGQEIRNYGNSNYGKGIVVEDESTGMMMFLRYGRGK